MSRGPKGFALAETLVAMAVSVAAMAMFFGAAGHAIRLARSGNETAWASQLLQSRSESFHTNQLWSNLITVSGFNGLVSQAPPPSANFARATETYTVTPYPANGATFSVVRNPNGTTTTSGASLSASQRCVKISARLNWVGSGKPAQSRTQVTLMSKGGL